MKPSEEDLFAEEWEREERAIRIAYWLDRVATVWPLVLLVAAVALLTA